MIKINKKFLLFIAVILSISIFSNNSVKALSIADDSSREMLEDLQSFRQYKEVGIIGNILVPTVVELPIEDYYLERLDFAIVDETTEQFLPYYYKKDTVTSEASYSATSIPSVNYVYRMTDKNPSTYTEFELDENDKGNVTINLKSNVLVTSSAIVALLDQNIALPTSVEVSAVVDGRSKKLLAKTDMSQQTIRFPETTAREWTVIFNYAQPLRINEIRLLQENPDRNSSQAIRFLAQPDRHYKVYFNPDRYVKPKTSEAGNLSLDEGVIVLSSVASQSNPLYKQSDVDVDGVVDVYDNCVSLANTDQKDIDSNGRGDVCDDFDRDGIINSKDNCPNDPNKNQRDMDGDKIGDVCDMEESRITEKHKWLPWLGIGFALVVIIILFFITARSKSPLVHKDEEEVHDEHLE